MKSLSLGLLLVSSFSAVLPAAQNSISLYQLSHKPRNNARHLVDKGMLALKHRDYATGLDYFQKAVADDPDYWRAQNNEGYAYLKLHLRPEARQAFERAIEIDPNNPIGNVNLGICALSASDFTLAEQSARRALKISPDLIDAKAVLGIARAGQGDWTPHVRKLLEESRSISASVGLLSEWPADASKAHRVLVLSSSR